MNVKTDIHHVEPEPGPPMPIPPDPGEPAPPLPEPIPYPEPDPKPEPDRAALLLRLAELPRVFSESRRPAVVAGGLVRLPRPFRAA